MKKTLMNLGYNLTRSEIKLIDGGVNGNATCVCEGIDPICLDQYYYSNGDGKKYVDNLCTKSYSQCTGWSLIRPIFNVQGGF
ncbi:MAG: hypothetical protein QM535_22395 [Limnohabitans sp.]|nr:hypothetical protein [Limnohabitans sp.]